MAVQRRSSVGGCILKLNILERQGRPAHGWPAAASCGEGQNACGRTEVGNRFILMGAPPHTGLEQRLRRSVLKNRAAALRPDFASLPKLRRISPLANRLATHHFSGIHEKIS